MSHRLALSLATLALLTGGCGLTEYEDKMVKEQKKQEVRDEQAKFLGDRAEIKIQTEQGSNTPPAEVFFRLPKGINATSGGVWGGMYQQYFKKPPERRMPGVTPPPETPFLDVLIAAVPGGDWKEFTDKAQQPFQAMNHTEFTRSPKTPPGRPPLDFQTTTYTDTASSRTSYIVYFYQSPQARLAIAFHVYAEKATVADVTKSIDVCLQSLTVGPEAAAARQQRP